MASQARKITTDTVLLFFGRVAGLGLNLVRIKYIAMYLGVNLFGIYSFATYFVAMFAILFDLGLPQILTREIAADSSRTQKYVYNTFIVKLFLIVVTSILVAGVTVTSDFDALTNWAIFFTVLSTASLSLTGTFYSAFQAHHKMKLVSALMLLNDIGTSIAIIVLILQGYGLFAILWGTLLLNVVNFLISLLVARKLLGYYWGGSLDRNLWQYLFRESYPIALSSVGITMYLYLSSSLLKYMKGDELMGYYGAALKLVTIMSLIPNSFSQVMYPIFSELYTTGASKLRSMLETSIRYLLIVSIPLSIGAILIADKLIVTLYSEAFRPAIIPLQILMIANLFSYANWLLYSFLSAIKKQRFQMYVTIITGMSVAVTNFLLIPHFDLLVPSISLAVVEVILFSSALVYLRKTDYQLFVYRVLWQPVAAALLMAIVVFTTKALSMTIQIMLGAVTFGATFLAVGGVREEDKKIFRNIFPSFAAGKNGVKQIIP